MLNTFNLIGEFRLFLLDLLGSTNIRAVLDTTRKEQYYPKDTLRTLSKEKLYHLFDIAKNNTDYYKNASSYESLNVLTKNDIRQQMNSFIVNNYPFKLFKKSTSGSTGTPLSYLTTSTSRSYLWTGIILSWEVAGYKLGDRVAFIAGTALLNHSSKLKHAIFYKLFNIDGYSAFSLSDDDISRYLKKIISRKTKIIYGYASALDKIASYLKYHPEYSFPNLKGIICTSEMLTDVMRVNIAQGFKTRVLNQYGCNEAGVSAFECEANQLHLISTRAFIESDISGNLIATDLSNEGFPIIKYNTGDIVEFSDTINCTCKRNFPILTNVLGRSGDIVIDTNKKAIHCAFFQLLFRPEKSITQYQITFDDKALNIYINTDGSISDRTYYNKFLNEIKKHLKFETYNLYFNAPFFTTSNAKHKHVVNLIP
ncbi:MAG: hypothetical protein ACOVJ8_09720 [Sediminibacterium sp.]